MKHILLFSFAIASIGASAQRDHRVEIEPAIEQITVYLNGGEVRTSKDIDLIAGRNVVLVKGLSPHLHPQSVQATVKSDGSADASRILSVSTASNFLDAGKLEPRIAVLRDSVHLLNDHITDLADRIAANDAEKEMLAENHDIGGTSAAVSAEQLAKAADFFRERTLSVNRTQSKLNKEQVQLQEQLARVEQQLSELNYRHNPERKEVTIVVLADKTQRAHLDLRYLVANTGWAPIYDLVAKNNNGPIQLRYKAQVYNNTGLDWNNVKLVLSTADPSLGANKPELDRWVLNYNESSIRGHSFGKKSMDSMIMQRDQRFDGADMDLQEKMNGVIHADATQQYTTIAVSEVSAEFIIPRPYDIPNDAKPYLVDISEHNVEASYGYVAVPKLDKDAFLLARITGWQKLNLVDGKANVYYGDSYVGESYISTIGAEDTLDLSLGRDRSVQLDRKLKEEMTTNKLLGNDRKETSTYEITVRNNSAAAVNIDVLDQVPVSQDQDIKVSILELSEAQLNPDDGLATWHTALQPGATVKYTLSYSIQYPKNRRPGTTKRYRVVAAPSF